MPMSEHALEVHVLYMDVQHPYHSNLHHFFHYVQLPLLFPVVLSSTRFMSPFLEV
jgi:hypothetical protein